MSGDIFELDQGDRETLRGTLHDPAATAGDVLTVQADKSIAAAPGGSVSQEARYSGAGVAIPNGDNALLPWTTLTAGTDLLDRTNVVLPKFLTDGVYSLTCGVVGEVLTPGDYCRIGIQCPAVGAIFYTATERPDYGDFVTAVFRAGAGAELDVVIENHDSVSARSFNIDRAILVKIGA